ncbi:hypothetical protein R1sor_010111 [Riccia sorocarpa]|uniref:Uncharacterized protein n=1 Tax=Riccia sorocarpa TaxID=122646 RepID=A0ABD3I113_9MARC
MAASGDCWKMGKIDSAKLEDLQTLVRRLEGLLYQRTEDPRRPKLDNNLVALTDLYMEAQQPQRSGKYCLHKTQLVKTPESTLTRDEVESWLERTLVTQLKIGIVQLRVISRQLFLLVLRNQEQQDRLMDVPDLQLDGFPKTLASWTVDFNPRKETLRRSATWVELPAIDPLLEHLGNRMLAELDQPTYKTMTKGEDALGEETSTQAEERLNGTNEDEENNNAELGHTVADSHDTMDEETQDGLKDQGLRQDLPVSDDQEVDLISGDLINQQVVAIGEGTLGSLADVEDEEMRSPSSRGVKG